MQERRYLVIFHECRLLAEKKSDSQIGYGEGLGTLRVDALQFTVPRKPSPIRRRVEVLVYQVEAFHKVKHLKQFR